MLLVQLRCGTKRTMMKRGKRHANSINAARDAWARTHGDYQVGSHGDYNFGLHAEGLEIRYPQNQHKILHMFGTL